MEKHAFVRSIDSDEGVNVIFRTLQERLPLILKRFKEEKELVIHTDTTILPRIVQAIKEWVIMQRGPAEISIEVPPSSLGVRVYSSMFGTPGAELSLLSSKELLYVCFYISVVMIRVTAEAFVDVERESDYIEEFSNEEGTEIWNGLSEWPLAILRYAWYHRTESTSSQRVVLAAGQALGALSRVDVNCFITTVSKAIQQYPVDSRSKRTKMTAQWPAGMDSIFFALSYVVLPQDISGDAKLTEMRNLLNMVSQYTTSKLPKDPEQLSRLYGLLEGLEYFLSQVNFADVGPAAGAAGGRFDASNSALRRLFSSKVQPIYAWATNISRANDLKVKAGALRTMCSILSCAPFDFFRNNFSNFVQKRVLYNMGIQRKAYNLVPLLLKVLRGPSLQGRGGRGCGGTFTLIHSWHRKGAVWDQLESKTAEGENCVDNTGQWSRVCRPGLHSSILVTTQLQSICRTMFRKKTITKLPRATFPTLIAIGAQLAVHSLTMVFGECIRPLLRGGTKVDDLLCAGVALRIVLQILDPNFQTEASERARLAQDEDSEMQWRRRLQNFMNQLEGDVNRIIDSCISVCSSRRPLQKSNDSTYESTIREENKDNGEIQPASSSKFLPSPRRWRRAGLVSRVRKRGVDDINSREPIILLPTRVSLLNCPSTKNMNGIGDDSQKVENYFMQAELKALSSAFPERVQTVDVDAEIKKSQDHKRIDAAMIAEDSLGAALSVLIFVRPVTPAQSLGKLLHPSMKKATKGMVSRYVRRVCVYQPEGFPSLIFSIVKRIIATAGRDSGGTAILLNNIRIAVVEWGGACVEAAGWLKHARRSVLPVIHAVSLCLLSHPSVMTRKAALSLTKEATEVETKLINSWSGWTQSPNEEVEARVVSRSLAFSLIEGVNGESVLAASATDSYHRHFSRFYLPSDSAASINISSMPRVPWMSSLVSIAQSLYMPQFGKNLANAFESQSSRKCSFASKRQQVGALALKIGLAMNKRLLQQDPEPPLTDSEKEWCFASVPLLLALSPIVASPPNYTPLSTRTDKEETKERARRKNTQKRDRKHWKRLMVTEQKEVQIRMEKNSKQLKSNIQIHPMTSKLHFTRIIDLMKLISTSESFLQSCDFADPNVEVASEDSLDYAASIAMIARNAELNPEGGMKALLFAIENAHSNYIPWILESFVLFSNLPTIKNTSSDSEVRLRNGELLRTRTDATRSMLFYALSGNKSLAHACSSNSGLAEALIVEAMRANTERVVAWGLGSVTIRNAARSIRNIGSTLLLQKIPKDRRNGNTFISLPDKRNLSLSVSRSHTDDKSSRIDNIDLVIPVPMVLDKVTTLLAWAQATSDALTVNNDRILKEMKVWSRRKRPARARSNIRASNTSVFKRMGSGSEESQNNDKNGTTGIHAAAKLDITATAQTPMAESTPGSPLRKLPVSSRANSKSISVISTIPENTDKTPEKIRNVIGTFLLKSRPDSNEKEEIKAWVVDLMELRNACFEAIGSLVWVGGLGVGKKAADIYDENPDDLELWRRYDEDIDIEARKSAQGWIRSFLATEVVSINTKPGSNGIESPSMFALGSSIGYSFRKSKLRMQNKPLNTPKISCHPREAYGALCALLMHHWTVVFDVILNEVYSPIPRGGAFGRGTAFAAIASRFQEISIAGARDSSQHTRSITSLTAQRGVFNQSIEFCSEMKLGTTSNEAAISKENAVELLIVGMTYAGHPILKISDMGVRILCALVHTAIWIYMAFQSARICPIKRVDKERIRRCLIQRLLSVRKVIDIACETTHNRERHQYPAGNIDTFYRGDRTVAPFPHLILPLTATEAGEWTTTSDALSWMLRVARPFLQAYPTSTNRTGDSSDRDSMDKVFKTLVNEKPNHYLATLIGLSVVLGNSVNGTDQVVEDALAELWYSTLFNFPDLTDPMDIQTTNTTGLEATATKRKSERKRHDSTAMSEKRLRERNNLIAVVLPAIVLCLRLLSGAPGISYSGIFQADFIRVASLSSHLQIHSSPALSICRMVAMAASRGGRVYTVSMKSFLTWTLCQSNFLAEVWWKSKATRGGNENDFENTFHMRQEGERYIWGAAAGLLSQLLRVEKVIENEKNHEENERNLGKLFFSCFHHLEGSPCLSPSLLKYLLQRLSKMRHKNTDSLGDFIIPHGLHLRRYYWRDTESFEDENKIINTFGEMRNPKGSWLADFVSPAPLPRRGIAARAGRPLDADAAWRRGMSLILVEEVRKDAEIGVDVNSRHNDSSYFDLKASSRVLLQENFDIASGRTTTDDISKGTEILSELINPAFIGLERGNSGVISADSLLCGIVHQLIKRRRTVMLKAWMEEALKHTERIVNGPDSKLKIASPSSAASARQLRDLLAILSPSFACKLDLSRRISAVLSEIIPKPREVSIHIAARKTSSEKTLVDIVTCFEKTIFLGINNHQGGIQMDLKKTITKEKIVCIMGLMLPWIYCLYDARSPTDQRLTQSAELLSSECFQVEVAPESLCESLASSIEILHEELGSKDVELVNLCTVLRSNYSSMLRLMSTAAVQSPHAVVKEGVLRFTSMILKESPTHLGIKSLHLTALISALKPLIEEVMKAGDEAARDVVASYVWSARATTTLTENNVAKMGRIELWEPLGKHGVNRGFLREIAERGWVDHKSLVDTNRCFQWIGKGIPMEIQHEITQQEGWSSAHQLNSKEDIKSTPIRSSQAHIQGREVQISFGELYDKKIQQKNKDALEKPSISSKAAKILGFNGSEKLPSSEDKGFLRSKSSSVKIKIQTQTNKGKGTNERKIAAHIAGRNSSPPFLQKRGSLRPSSPLRGRTVDESMAKRDGQTKTADTGMPNMARKKVSSRERKALNSALLSAGLVEPLDVHHRQHIKKNLRYTDSNGERIHTNSGNQKQTAEKNDAAARLAAVIRGGVAKTRNAKHEMIEPIHKATSQQFQKQELGNVSQKVTLQKTCDKKETTVEEDLVSKYLNLSNEKNKVLDDENVQSYTAEKEDNDENCQDAHEEDFDEDEDEMWEEVRSPTGDMYFWNTITDEVQWERPACMKTSGENSHG
eukprot:jgi/Bigna1/146828/aug1.122_g21536